MLKCLVAASLLLTACAAADNQPLSLPQTPAAKAMTVPVATATPSPVSSATPRPALTASPTASPAATPAPTATPSDIPVAVETLNFGLPAGNGYQPLRLALDPARRRVYTLNRGLFAGTGNTLSIFDLDSGRFTGLLALNNRPPAAYGPPDPLALLLDPYRPRLYAIWATATAKPPPAL